MTEPRKSFPLVWRNKWVLVNKFTIKRTAIISILRTQIFRFLAVFLRVENLVKCQHILQWQTFQDGGRFSNNRIIIYAGGFRPIAAQENDVMLSSALAQLMQPRLKSCVSASFILWYKKTFWLRLPSEPTTAFLSKIWMHTWVAGKETITSMYDTNMFDLRKVL